jgi:hypothetical protein
MSLRGHMSRCTGGTKRQAPILFSQVNAELVEPVDLGHNNDLPYIDDDVFVEEGAANTSGAMTMYDSRR